MSEIKYPVKYGLLPIKDYDKIFGNILVSNVRNVAYVVSKCYLLSKTTTYERDGSESSKYRVVFPFTGIFLDEKMPENISDMNEVDYISYVTENVFDTYEEAKEICNSKNKKLIEEELKNKKRVLENYKNYIEKKVENLEVKSEAVFGDLEALSEIYSMVLTNKKR